MDALRQQGRRLDAYLADSKFGRLFRLDGSGHVGEIPDAQFLTEVRAGVTTFFTMAYIIAVNATVLTDSGGTCECRDASDPTCANDQDYQTCLIGLNRDLITATSAISAFASFFFGLITNLPVALAPGMGLNAYFTYQVVGFHGTRLVPYGLALTAVFAEGFIFILLSLLGMRQWLVRMLPTSLKVAAACGIGLFLAEIGLSYSAGIGAISGASATPLDLAGCPPEYRDEFGECQSHKMQNPTLWIGLFCGGILTAYLMSYKVKSAMIIGILVVSIISWPRGTSVTYFPDTPEGDSQFDFFKKVITFHPIEQTLNALDWNISRAPGEFALALFTFLYVDIIDCTATLYTAYCTDAFSISVGALFGVSPVTAFIESGAGIAEGGKTGLTAMTTGLCFFISLFFAPIFASIPPWATGCTLVLVGAMMVRQVVAINWRYIGDAVPAFVTIIFVPMSYSTAYGMIAGILTYVAINVPIALTRIISRGRITPADEDAREYWNYKPTGSSPWFVNTISNAFVRFGHHGDEAGHKARELESRGSHEMQKHLRHQTHGSLGDESIDIKVGDAGFDRHKHDPSFSVSFPMKTYPGVRMPPMSDDREPDVERFDLRQFRVAPSDRI
ncbi:putative xanthine/uracil permease [Lasiodiplodia theobromae]|uniref:Putative xanthine/uracil permease n=1 Tax=Lasiodiplodia theobromae TaxID=45133 RepID=A0A5N5DFC7_9PEZI|nr:putative xanthine/uracil permease [Lasiodiplodia theobromae]